MLLIHDSTPIPKSLSSISKIMPALIIQMMAFTQIINIWTSGITVWDHLKIRNLSF